MLDTVVSAGKARQGRVNSLGLADLNHFCCLQLSEWYLALGRPGQRNIVPWDVRDRESRCGSDWLVCMLQACWAVYHL